MDTIDQININQGNDKLTYNIGYYMLNNKVVVCLDILINDHFVCSGYYKYDMDQFYFHIFTDNESVNGNKRTAEKMIEKISKYIYIPAEVEEKFINLFLLYKLNNFNED